MFQESGQSSCISGCEAMRKIQRDQVSTRYKIYQQLLDFNKLRSNVGLERKADKKEEEEEADIKVDEMKKDTEDIKVKDIQSVGKSEEDPGHLRTYILVASEDAFINLTNHIKWHPMSQQ